MNFYDQVLRELLAAVGAALFIGNLLALVRRRQEGSPGREPEDLERAPTIRTVVYLVLGFVVMVWAIASIAVA